MALIRFIIVLFNVAIITFLIYRMLKTAREPGPTARKVVVIVGGIMLLLAPAGMFFGIFVPAFQYFIIYPAAIFLFLALTRQVEW